MKAKTFFIVVLSLIMTGTLNAQSLKSNEEKQENKVSLKGTIAPDFTLEDYKGKIWHLTDFRGKIVVIDFWATWCGVCIENLPLYAQLGKQYKGDDRIEFITISIDSRSAQKRWMYSLPRFDLMDFVNLISPAKESNAFADTFQVHGVPRYVIIGPDGKVIDDKAPSPHDGLKEYIENLLKQQQL